MAAEFLTVSQIAKLVGVERHRVQYALESRGQKPTGRAGSTNVYPPSVLAVVRNALAAAGSRGPRGDRPHGETSSLSPAEIR
jgi:hypothetical protein